MKRKIIDQVIVNCFNYEGLIVVAEKELAELYNLPLRELRRIFILNEEHLVEFFDYVRLEKNLVDDDICRGSELILFTRGGVLKMARYLKQAGKNGLFRATNSLYSFMMECSLELFGSYSEFSELA